jgi:undecaprenyl-diphosphatase
MDTYSPQTRSTDPEHRSRARLLVLVILVFGLIAQWAARGKPLAFDSCILLALHNSTRPPAPRGPAWLQEAARDVTSLGSIVVLAIVTFSIVGYLFLAHRPGVASLMLIAVLGGLALNNLLKLFFARPRPGFVTHAARVFTTSFPSGHATLSAITYLTIGALLARTFPTFPVSLYFMSLATFLTVLVGVSRVYLGVHYPTDVLGGWCIGAAWAIVCWLLTAWLQHGGQVEPPSPV